MLPRAGTKFEFFKYVFFFLKYSWPVFRMLKKRHNTLRALLPGLPCNLDDIFQYNIFKPLMFRTLLQIETIIELFENFCKLKQLSSFSSRFQISRDRARTVRSCQTTSSGIVAVTSTQKQHRGRTLQLYMSTTLLDKMSLALLAAFFKTMLHDTSHALGLQIGCLFSESIILIVVWHASIYPGRFSIYPEVGVYRWPRLLLLCLAK